MAENSLFTILHISDFHSSSRKRREQQIVVDALIADLEKLCIGHRKPDVVIFSGDLVEVGGVDLQSPAGIGVAAIVYNYDGDVYASDESRMLAEMGDKSFCIGNVHRDSYEDIFLSDRLLEALESSFAASAPMCSWCAFEPYCGADPVFHHATQSDVEASRVFRRLLFVRRSYDERYEEQVFA